MIVLLKLCVKIALCAGAVAFNFILWFFFGLLISGRRFKESPTPVGAAFTLVTGFFLYYSLFDLFAIPVMYRWRPLSMLSVLWAVFTVVIVLLSAFLNRRVLKPLFVSCVAFVRKNKVFCALAALIVLVQLIMILHSYQFTLDAAFYVANVTTSVQTNSLGIYNPYTGDWQDHFEMRYFFATYPYQDAVMCYLFKIPALIQTKIIMASVVIFLTNLLYLMTGHELLEGEKRERGLLIMLFFAGLINFFFITIYTTSAFLTTRTYEGKSILANVVLPMILFLFIRMIKTGKGMWGYLFLLSFGSTVISNTSNMLVPAAISVLALPYVISSLRVKDIKAALRSLLGWCVCCLPGIALSLVYVAYVKGMFVFYTYPR